MDGVHQGICVSASVSSRKANVAADSSSRKPRCQLAILRCSLFRDLVTLSEFDFRPDI